MALEASPVNERKRVKVYELKDSDWWDRGTGFVAVQIILVSVPFKRRKLLNVISIGSKN